MEGTEAVYNGFMCGYDYLGKKEYNRNAEKRKPLDEKRGIESLFFLSSKKFFIDIQYLNML